jgi:hypothetical protein
MIRLKTMSVLLVLFLAHPVMLPILGVHYTAAGQQMITRMQDKLMLCRLHTLVFLRAASLLFARFSAAASC